MENTISHLRTFFKITTAAFTFMDTMKLVCGGSITPNKIKELHECALEEIEKENPSLVKIDYLLSQMENLAKSYNQIK